MKTNANLAIPNSTLRLGDRVKDEVTGAEGILTAHHSYLTGCQRVTITGAVNKDGRTFEHYSDLMTVKLIKRNAVNAKPVARDVPAAG